jgi:hypothetical protein
MTIPAKIEANRRNAKLSTGPRSATGKGVVARNPVRHGVFAHMPVVPGENPYDWDRHRSGIVASFAPVGLLERTLAERVALLLWRFARLARFEAGVTAAAVEDAGLLPPEADPFTASLRSPIPNTDDYLKITDQQLRLARVNHAEVLATAELLRGLGEAGGLATCRTDLVVLLLGWAHAETCDYAFRRFEPLHHSDPGFLPQIGLTGAHVREVVWTPELLGRAIDYYARATEGTAAQFRAQLQQAIDMRVAALEREVKRLEGDSTAIVRRDESRRARAADVALMPPEQVADRIVKYEKHLHSQLASTLHELERLQARRGGVPVVPPIVAHIQATVIPALD